MFRTVFLFAHILKSDLYPDNSLQLYIFNETGIFQIILSDYAKRERDKRPPIQIFHKFVSNMFVGHGQTTL
ncbi:hypothetical protein HME9304_02583 [Flagellimonas maritima]|uniref:Uncharacterized protein n=1 Tax=Flagellimonas maritima TaxID=1383885 RepID=A0A2Z4LUY1_9FLAO|nr:hypothetical protein HME9304_02583 [Allomuricauda aurantiaca]